MSASSTIDIQPESSAAHRSLLTYTGYAAFVLLGWNTVLVPSLIRSIEHGFGQSDAGFAVLYLLKSILYAAGAFSGGMLTERFGRRVVLLAGTLIPAAGLVGSALAPDWIWFIVLNAAVSWGTGVIDGGMNGLFLDLHRDARGSALNVLHGFFALGALIAPFVVGLLVSAGVDWHAILLASGAGFFLLAVPLGALAMPAGHRTTPPPTPAEDRLEMAERSLLPFVALATAIALYTGAEIGVSSWVVKMLSTAPLTVATGILSLFWAGLTAGRLLSRWVAERLDYTLFTLGCFVTTAISLAGAVVSPWLLVTALLFTLAGFCCGPIYPMIIALGGNIYPHRLSALSGALTTAGAAGVIVYPPLMGLLAAHIGLRAGMMGAALLCIPGAVAILAARRPARHSPIP